MDLSAGTLRIAGKAAPDALHALSWPDLVARFAALRSARARIRPEMSEAPAFPIAGPPGSKSKRVVNLDDLGNRKPEAGKGIGYGDIARIGDRGRE